MVALVIASVASVPYVALTPGPTLNTLGKSGGSPMIEISGHRTYPTSGHLNMVTVSFIGGQGTLAQPARRGGSRRGDLHARPERAAGD